MQEGRGAGVGGGAPRRLGPEGAVEIAAAGLPGVPLDFARLDLEGVTVIQDIWDLRPAVPLLAANADVPAQSWGGAGGGFEQLVNDPVVAWAEFWAQPGGVFLHRPSHRPPCHSRSALRGPELTELPLEGMPDWPVIAAVVMAVLLTFLCCCHRRIRPRPGPRREEQESERPLLDGGPPSAPAIPVHASQRSSSETARDVAVQNRGQEYVTVTFVAH